MSRQFQTVKTIANRCRLLRQLQIVADHFREAYSCLFRKTKKYGPLCGPTSSCGGLLCHLRPFLFTVVTLITFSSNLSSIDIILIQIYIYNLKKSQKKSNQTLFFSKKISESLPFFLKKINNNKAIILVLLFKEIIVQPQLSTPQRFRIQGGYLERHKRTEKGGGRKFLCLMLNDHPGLKGPVHQLDM